MLIARQPDPVQMLSPWTYGSPGRFVDVVEPMTLGLSAYSLVVRLCGQSYPVADLLDGSLADVES